MTSCRPVRPSGAGEDHGALSALHTGGAGKARRPSSPEQASSAAVAPGTAVVSPAAFSNNTWTSASVSCCPRGSHFAARAVPARHAQNASLPVPCTSLDFPSLVGPMARNQVAPAAADHGVGLVDPSPHLRAHPAVGIPPVPDLVRPVDVHGNLTRLLAGPQSVKHFHKSPVLAPHPAPSEGPAGPPRSRSRAFAQPSVASLKRASRAGLSPHGAPLGMSATPCLESASRRSGPALARMKTEARRTILQPAKH